jgi:hypothetical protein
MSELSDRQRQFTLMTAHLIISAYTKGYALRYLCSRCAHPGHHRANSLHYDGLAVDFALDIRGADGKWHYTERSEDHREIGELWETMGGSWGGRFSSPDGNHYSLEYQGRR